MRLETLSGQDWRKKKRIIDSPTEIQETRRLNTNSKLYMKNVNAEIWLR
jgi:hypothetical protein